MISEIVKNVDPKILEHKELIMKLIGEPIYDFSQVLSTSLPQRSGVYRIFEKENQTSTIYIGKSKNLKRRIINNHLKGTARFSALRRKLIKVKGFLDEEKVTQYLSSKCSVQFIELAENMIAGFEHFAISVLAPQIND